MGQQSEEPAGPRVANAADAYAIARRALPEPGIGVLHLDRDGRLLGISSTPRSAVLPVQLALRHAVAWGSSALLIAQLRAGDDPAPSPDEIGATQARAVTALLAAQGLAVDLRRDLGGHDRCAVATP